MLSDGLGEFPRVVFVGEPVRAKPCHICRSDSRLDHVPGKETIPDELLEGLADSFLIFRDNGRSGDRQIEGMAEQGHHGEPIGKGADHRGLAKSLDGGEEWIPVRQKA